MKRRVWAYALTGTGVLVAIVGAVLSFGYHRITGGAVAPDYKQCVVGGVLLLFALVLIGCLAGEIAQDNFSCKCEALFSAREFEEEKKLLDKVRKNHFLFPFMREKYYLIAIKNALARDDLARAKSYSECLRHWNDDSIKYKTSYATTLILLDEEEEDKARTEYEDFRIHNERYALYKEQLEVLNAIFARLFGRCDVPLPQAAVDSPFPVVKRILGKYFERTAEDAREAQKEQTE